VSKHQDRPLTCSRCGREFVWDAQDQALFAEKRFGPPKRCKDCRRESRARREEAAKKGGKK
jgi:hypothetical protein